MEKYFLSHRNKINGLVTHIFRGKKKSMELLPVFTREQEEKSKKKTKHWKIIFFLNSRNFFFR